MKKLLLSATLLLSVATFAQKEELKILKRMVNIESEPSQKDFDKFNEAIKSLDTKIDLLSDDDKVLYYYSKVSQPIMEIMMIGMKNPNDKASIQKVYEKFNSPDFLKSLGSNYNLMVDLEKKTGKSEYTNDIKPMIQMFKEQLNQSALSLNNASKFKEASATFYSLYSFDPKNEGKSLNNAAILAVQANDYKLGQKLYEEFNNSDYLKNGVIYTAINKASGSEEEFNSKEERSKYISLGTHEKPKDSKVSANKSEVLRVLSILYTQNGEFAKAKETYAEARKLLPNDEELKTGEFNLYFNSGYAGLAEDDKLVTEINNSRADKKKYDELMKKRKEMFAKSLPDFEKAYSINPKDENTKSILKMSYEITGQPEKAKAIN